MGSFSSRPVLVESNTSQSTTTDALVELAVSIISSGIQVAAGLFLINFMFNRLRGVLGNEDDSAFRKEFLRKLAVRLGRPDIETMSFDAHEVNILGNVIGPNEIDTTFADIGGLENELEEVKDNVILPIKLWEKFRNSRAVAAFPTGMLLYGRPGTGKSLTAKAIAKESGTTFISIKASTIMDKYVGESDKLVVALFSVARKLSPSIIFIDEIDTMLSKRDSTQASSNQSLASVQGVFFQEWDGLRMDSSSHEAATAPIRGVRHQSSNRSENAPVIVLGATNRPADLDKAFLRRLPVQIKIRDPTTSDRLSIFKALLRKERLSEDVDLELLAKATGGLTGSDIREIIRVAALQRMKSMSMAERLTLNSPALAMVGMNEGLDDLPPLTSQDFQVALIRRQQAAKEVNSFSDNIYRDEAEAATARYGGRYNSEDASAALEQQRQELLQMLAHLQGNVFQATGSVPAPIPAPSRGVDASSSAPDHSEGLALD